MIKRFLAILSCAHAVIADEKPKIGFGYDIGWGFPDLRYFPDERAS